MIPERINTNEFDRNPEIYLGIDGSVIPFEYFKGVYFEDGMVFTDDVFYGVQFIVSKKDINNPEDVCENGVLIVFYDNAFVTKEDIVSNDRWFKIGHSLGEFVSTGDRFNFSNADQKIQKIRSQLTERYQNGEQGNLFEEEKIYDNEGVYYMWFNESFNTDEDEETFAEKFKRHANFLHRGDNPFSAFRIINVKCSRYTWLEILSGLQEQGYIPMYVNIDSMKKVDLNLLTSFTDPRLGGTFNFIETQINNLILEKQNS